MRKFVAATKNRDRAGLLQCGRIYKDAEIALRRALMRSLLACFNVAASIKMRKCALWVLRCVKLSASLQCGRIYKDAEIRRFIDSALCLIVLQCGRIYKDAEIRETMAEGA